MRNFVLAVFALVSCANSRAAQSPQSTSAALAAVALSHRGVNLAGAEFAVDPWGNGALPGTHGTNYIWPDATYVPNYTSLDYFIGKGMNTFRVPFRWERLQPARNQPFNSAEQSRLVTTINRITSKGAHAIVDLHNYARFGTAVIGSSVPNADFADLWSRLATLFKSNSRVIFGLMNEPHDMPTEQWFNAAQSAVTAIRATGAGNLILVPGNGWDGAHSWIDSWYGSSNASVMIRLADPSNNFAFEVHQYLDQNSSGSSTSCTSLTIGSQRLSNFTNWLKTNGKRGFLGEFGGGPNPACSAAIDDMLKHLEANANVWAGWTYWAAGPWWGSGNTFPSIEPRSGADAYQMSALIPHLTPPPTPCALSVTVDDQTLCANRVVVAPK